MDLIQHELGQRRSKRKTVSCYHSSRKRKKTIRRYLPEDIIRIILQKLPAELVYNVMRNVCTNWRNTILHDFNFINSHLKNSSHGFIFSYDFRWRGFKFVEATNPNGREIVVTIHKFDFDFSEYICSTCNGLILARIRTTPRLGYDFWLQNPITQQALILPPSSVTVNRMSTTCYIGYVASSGEYKVVKTYSFTDKNSILFEILTLGPNKHGHWRYLHRFQDPTWFPLEAYSAGGFIYWQNLDSSCLMSLNLENETFSKIPFPSAVKGKLFLVMEDKLTLVSVDCRRMLFYEIWLLVEEDHKWMKLCVIDFHGQTSLLRSFLQGQESVLRSLLRGTSKGIFGVSPVGWLKYKEVLAFVVSGIDEIFIAYNIMTGKMYPFRVENTYGCQTWNFVKSLVSPDASWINSKN